jgi:hypothetical protein
MILSLQVSLPFLPEEAREFPGGMLLVPIICRPFLCSEPQWPHL